jgi:microcystin degradation protein MlrC
MRIGIIALLHETNTFIGEPTTIANFEREMLLVGEAIRERCTGTEHEIGGFLLELDRREAEAVPIFVARALPFGTVTDETYAELLRRMFAALTAAAPLDGLLLAPHGATVSETVRDVDGDWMTRVREAVGPDVPIVATADPHANLSARMVAAVDAIVAYRSNPHVDQRARGVEAASLVCRAVTGEIRPTQAAAFPPMAMPIDRQCTSEEPCASFVRRFVELRARHGLLSASLFFGFPYADVPEMGTAVNVVTDGDPALAQRLADELAGELWDRREEFRSDLLDVPAGVDRALELESPVCLLDMGDNVGGGSPADGTFLAHEFLRRGLGPTFVCLCDPEAVRTAEAAGVGATLDLAVGGRTDALHGPPLDATFRVQWIGDGRFSEPEARHGGMRDFDQGRTAIVTTGPLTIMLTSRRMVPFSLHQLTDLGLDPASFRFLVAKGVNAPLAAYAPVCNGIVRIDTPGVTSCDVNRLAYEHRRRPMFPFEEGVSNRG